MSPSVLFVILSNIIFVNGQISRNPLTGRTDSTTQTLISNEGPWGSWGGMRYCDEGQWLKTIDFRSESSQGGGDDVAGVGVALICEEPGSTIEYRYEYRSYSSPHNWGSWYGTSPGSCPSGSWVVGFRTNIERWCHDNGCNIFTRPQCCGVDDTSLNCIQLLCSDGKTVLTPTDCRSWGDGYPSSYSQCNNGYICGWNEKFEEDQAVNDETGLNAVRFRCCDYTDSPTKSPTPAPTRNPTPAPTRNPTPSPTRSPSSSPSDTPTSITPSPTELTYPPTTSPLAAAALSTNAGSSNIILGIVLGMLCCLCIIIIIGYFWWKNRKSEQSVDEEEKVQVESPVVDEHEDNAEMVMSIGMEGTNKGGTTGKGTKGQTNREGMYNEDRHDMTEGGGDDDVDEDPLPKE